MARVLFGVGLTWYPWRKPDDDFKWNKNTARRLRKEVIDIKPTTITGLNSLRALTIGARGHGKTSLINTLASLSVGRKTTVCNAAFQQENVTTHFRHVEFPPDCEFKNCSFADISGIPSRADLLATLADIKLVLKGHILSEYKLNPKCSIEEDDKFYNSKPELSDRIHCAIIVYDSTLAYEMHANYIVNIKTIMDTLHSENIPVLVALTKVDKLSEHVKSSIDTIFRCKKVRAAVDNAARQLVIPASKVFPVVNFEEMDSFSWKETIPALLIMRAYLSMAKLHSHNVAFNHQ